MKLKKLIFRITSVNIVVFISLIFVACDFSNKGGPDTNISTHIGQSPNVVFILADDLGYHDLGAYGQELIETPNIDQLAVEGMRFLDFYAGSPVCAPSRSVLMTGQHTGHTKVRGNYASEGGIRKPPGSEEAPGIPRIGLQEGDITIGNLMQQAGYRTGLMGKWHLSGYDRQNLPIHRGFNEYRGSDNADDKSRAPDMEFYGDKVVEVPEEFRSDYNDDIKTRNAIDFIKRNSDQPFLLILSLGAPHKPFEIPSRGIYENQPWNEMSRNYAAMVTRLDQHVGIVMETLIEEGLDKNTVVIFGSDNGGEYRPYGGDNWKGDEEAYPVYPPKDWTEWTQLFRSNYPLKGGKADMYEGGIRVPLIMRWPGQIERGSVNTDPWHFMDFMPTLAALGGVEPPANTDGINMLPIIQGRNDYPKDRYLYWEFNHESFAQAVRWRDWKFIRWSTYRKRMYGQPEINDQRRSEAYPFLELYDLKQDINEENNVVEEYPQIRKIILDFLEEARTESPYFPLTKEEKEGLTKSADPGM